MCVGVLVDGVSLLCVGVKFGRAATCPMFIGTFHAFARWFLLALVSESRFFEGRVVGMLCPVLVELPRVWSWSLVAEERSKSKVWERGIAGLLPIGFRWCTCQSWRTLVRRFRTECCFRAWVQTLSNCGLCQSHVSCRCCWRGCEVCWPFPGWTSPLG